MARVTVAEVQEIFSTDMSSTLITAFITTANVLVNSTCALADPALGADLLKQVELWLAAHFANTRDPIALRAKVGDAEQTSFPVAVTTAWAMGLKLSPYGQMALALDTSGLLADLGLRKAKLRAAPREDSANFTENLTKTT